MAASKLQKKNASSPAIGAVTFRGLIGACGGREVFIGFAPASLLKKISFADVLNETTRVGYQRPINVAHSLGFKRYIQGEGATTIPLTFNLRGTEPKRWTIRTTKSHCATLSIDPVGAPIMAQVDCQHRLGYLGDSPIQFAFMTFIGLTVEEEMQIFRDINGKAKGLNASLLDYTSARLSDLGVAHPAIALAMRLQEDADSPWQHRLDLGGDRTSGLRRIASLRTMQKAIRRFQREAKADRDDLEVVARQLIAFWKAVVQIYPYQWMQHRRHLVNKGVGVYALMSMAGLLVAEAKHNGRAADVDFFLEKLSDFAHRVDWSTNGPMNGFGGAAGADGAFQLLKFERNEALKGLNGQQKHFAH